MPTTSPEAPTGTIETLGLPARAVTALTRAGITDVTALAGLSRRDLTAVPGLGPGLVTAIRRVVPEPPATLHPAAPAADPQLPLPAEAPAEVELPAEVEVPAEDDEGPAAPAIPSFASLRDPRRRTAFDLLVPEAAPAGGRTPDPAGSEAEPAEETEPEPEPEPAAAAPAPPVGGPRPAEYADLVRLGVRLARAAVVLPGRLAVWSVRTQADLLRRLFAG